MKKHPGFLLLLWATSLIVYGEPTHELERYRDVTFSSEPRGEVFLKVLDSEKESEKLGPTDQKIRMQSSYFGINQGQTRTFILRLAGHREEPIRLSWGQLSDGKVIDDHGKPILLAPDNFFVSMQDHWKIWSFLTTCLVSAGLFTAKKRQQASLALSKAQRIEAENQKKATVALIESNKTKQALAKQNEKILAREAIIKANQGRDPWLATVVGDYVPLAYLAKGNYGRVYKAEPQHENSGLPEWIALKIIDRGDNPEETEKRFLRELEIGQKLDHPGFMKFYGGGGLPNAYYLALELLPGGDLGKKRSAEGMPPEEFLQLVSPIFLALQFAHEQGIFHRDLKPENILLTQHGERR